MKALNAFNLNRQITTTFLPKHHSLTVKSRNYPRPYSLDLSPLLRSSRSSSPTALHGAVFPSPNFSRLGFFSSLSSSHDSQLSPSNNLNSELNDGKFFHWHKSPATGAGSGVSDGGKPDTAAVVLGWLGATPKHLRRYAELYTSRGIDAVTFVVPVKELMWFDLGRKVENRIEVLANEVVSWLSNDGGRERRLIFHTFSTTGWLVYGSILAHLQKRPDLIEKIKGCIVDSGGDPELNPKVWAAGFTAALLKKRNTRVSPPAEVIEPGIDKNKSLQDEDPHIIEGVLLLVFEKLFTFLFKLPEVSQRLLKIINLLLENQPPCPQLYLYSTADKVIPYRSVESFIERQKMKGRDVRSYNFGSSAHVDHYRTFPDVYSSQVSSFIDKTLVMEKQR